ncbi:MAG: hypothetical protein HKN85_07685 [Gammaproteobacteria bacterium]|nr:hypothetical protein [Gammaproteobacteria bacterium]
MKKSTVAVLFSAFVFPGAGHIFLKRYVSAAVIGGAALVALYLLASVAIDQAQKIADKILTGEIPAEISEITAAVLSQPGGSQTELTNMATGILIASWLLAIVDCLRLGRADNDRISPGA